VLGPFPPPLLVVELFSRNGYEGVPIFMKGQQESPTYFFLIFSINEYKYAQANTNVLEKKRECIFH
jgi:hypothetical protein